VTELALAQPALVSGCAHAQRGVCEEKIEFEFELDFRAEGVLAA